MASRGRLFTVRGSCRVVGPICPPVIDACFVASLSDAPELSRSRARLNTVDLGRREVFRRDRWFPARRAAKGPWLAVVGGAAEVCRPPVGNHHLLEHDALLALAFERPLLNPVSCFDPRTGQLSQSTPWTAQSTWLSSSALPEASAAKLPLTSLELDIEVSSALVGCFLRLTPAVVVSAKTTSDASNVHPFPPDPNSPQSTINTVAREIREAGGEAAAIAADTRDSDAVRKMVDEAVATFGRLDVLVYNSGAIWWASVENTPVKRFKLMQQVNVEGLYSATQAALPHFKNQAWKGRIVVVSPPIYSRFFRGKTAYAMGKVAMSVLTKGLAMDFAREGKKDMAISSMWVATAIQSAATVGREDVLSDLRKPVSAATSVPGEQLRKAQDNLLRCRHSHASRTRCRSQRLSRSR